MEYDLIEEVDYLEKMTEKWFLCQSKHKVSLSAANSFWDLALKYMPLLLQQRQKRVPKFVQQRKKMVQSRCPPVEMQFTFKNREDQSIVNVTGTQAPLKVYQNNPKYEKLLETAHVKVIISSYCNVDIT